METDLVERPAPPVRVEAHIALHPAPAVASGRPFALERAGWQCLPVSAHIRERYLVTFRAPADAVARLVPAPLAVDSFRGQGFVSVCALEMDDMGLVGTPSWLRWKNLELLYRVGVRAGDAPSFLTLRSDVSARRLALLGRYFSHYRPHLACMERAGRNDRFRLDCPSHD